MILIVIWTAMAFTLIGVGKACIAVHQRKVRAELARLNADRGPAPARWWA